MPPQHFHMKAMPFGVNTHGNMTSFWLAQSQPYPPPPFHFCHYICNSYLDLQMKLIVADPHPNLLDLAWLLVGTATHSICLTSV